MIRISNKKRLTLSEKQIENQILSWLKFKGILGFKVKSTGTFDTKLGRFRKPSPWYRVGVSDIICCHKGRFIGLEVKTHKGQLSEPQKLFMRDINAAGGAAIVVRSVEDVATFFQETVK